MVSPGSSLPPTRRWWTRLQSFPYPQSGLLAISLHLRSIPALAHADASSLSPCPRAAAPSPRLPADTSSPSLPCRRATAPPSAVRGGRCRLATVQRACTGTGTRRRRCPSTSPAAALGPTTKSGTTMPTCRRLHGGVAAVCRNTGRRSSWRELGRHGAEHQPWIRLPCPHPVPVPIPIKASFMVGSSIWQEEGVAPNLVGKDLVGAGPTAACMAGRPAIPPSRPECRAETRWWQQFKSRRARGMCMEAINYEGHHAGGCAGRAQGTGEHEDKNFHIVRSNKLAINIARSNKLAIDIARSLADQLMYEAR